MFINIKIEIKNINDIYLYKITHKNEIYNRTYK